MSFQAKALQVETNKIGNRTRTRTGPKGTRFIAKGKGIIYTKGKGIIYTQIIYTYLSPCVYSSIWDYCPTVSNSSVLHIFCTILYDPIGCLFCVHVYYICTIIILFTGDVLFAYQIFIRVFIY